MQRNSETVQYSAANNASIYFLATVGRKSRLGFFRLRVSG